MNSEIIVNLSYIVSSILFATGLKNLGSPVTARKGNMLSAAGMLLAVVATMFSGHIISYQWILLGLRGFGCLPCRHDSNARDDCPPAWMRRSGECFC
jgi:NAD/NADP transhydrogenase beta subunit